MQVFSFDLVDKDAGEIKVTGFNEMCDKFFARIEEGKVYQISKASVKPKKQGNVRPCMCMCTPRSPALGSTPLRLSAALKARLHAAACMQSTDSIGCKLHLAADLRPVHCAMPSPQALTLSCVLQRFNTTRHDCEMWLENGTILEEVHEDAATTAIPRMLYNVRPMLRCASQHACLAWALPHMAFCTAHHLKRLPASHGAASSTSQCSTGAIAPLLHRQS